MLIFLLVYIIFINFFKKYIVNLNYFYNYNLFISVQLTLINIIYIIINYLSFLPKYYSRNELIWVDGFLFDFLQKKSVDKWIRKFVIYTGFIFSERLVFDYVVRIYIDNIIWPLHYISMFEPSNVIEMLNMTIFIYFGLFSVFSLWLILLF